MALSKKYTERFGDLLEEYEGKMTQLNTEERIKEKDSKSNMQFAITVKEYDQKRKKMYDEIIASIQQLFGEFSESVESELEMTMIL